MGGMNPACAGCSAAAKPAGCGYRAAHTPCGNPWKRDEWAAAEIDCADHYVAGKDDAKGEGDAR